MRTLCACTYSPCLQRLVSFRVFQDIYVLRAVLGQAFLLAFLDVLLCAVLLCVYVVFVLLRYLEPNSCPALPSDAVTEIVDVVEDDAAFEAAVEKMFGLTVTMSSWPGFTSSITCCTLLKTTLTATDSTHRCKHMPRQSTVTHRDTLLRSPSSVCRERNGRIILQQALRVHQRVTKHYNATSPVASDGYLPGVSG